MIVLLQPIVVCLVCQSKVRESELLGPRSPKKKDAGCKALTLIPAVAAAQLTVGGDQICLVGCGDVCE